jgi:hypothetical protein
MICVRVSQLSNIQVKPDPPGLDDDILTDVAMLKLVRLWRAARNNEEDAVLRSMQVTGWSEANRCKLRDYGNKFGIERMLSSRHVQGTQSNATW